jgi:hypothetical protein
MIRTFFLRIILICLVVFISGIHTAAQEQSCSFVLKEAQKQYNLGQVEKIPGMIAGCLDNGFSRQERQDAYKLLILCYLSDDEQEKADSSMLAFLKRYPEYEIIPTDTREFTYLFNSYRTLPIISIGLVGGFSRPQFFVTESNSTFDLNSNARTYEPSGLSYQGGLKINTYLSDKYELELDVLFSQVSFLTTDVFTFQGKEIQKTEAIETQTRLRFPLSVQYALYPFGKNLLYARAGLIPSVALGDKLDPTRTYTSSVHNPVTGSAVDISAMRKKFDLSVLLGTGVKYKIPHGYLFAEIQYHPGITGQLNRKGLYAFPELQDRFYFLSDNFRINKLVFNIGYSYSFYKPTKKN